MTLFTWHDMYSVGVPSVDTQHKRLFEIANRLHDAHIRNLGRPLMAEIFKELIEYTAYHFADEERLMRDADYPDYVRHKANHEKLIELVVGYQRQLERGEVGIEERALEFVKTWLNGHILGMDSAYTPWVTTKHKHDQSAVATRKPAA